MTNTSKMQRRQELLQIAIERGIIDGCLFADGWAFLYLGDKSFRLSEGQLLAFLYGAVGDCVLPDPLEEAPGMRLQFT